jgi:glycine hydroxymethyltransferase
VPYEEAPPALASGVRAGTACVTTQGLGPAEMRTVAVLVGRALRADGSTAAGAAERSAVGREVRELLERFPAYPEQGGPF